MAKLISEPGTQRLRSARHALFFQAVFCDEIWNLGARTLGNLRALPAGELISCLDSLVSHKKIRITLADNWRDVISAPAPVAEKSQQWVAENPEFRDQIPECLGREAGAATMLVLLVQMGAIDNWVAASVRDIAAASRGRIGKSTVHRCAGLLADRGLLEMQGGNYFLHSANLDALLAANARKNLKRKK